MPQRPHTIRQARIDVPLRTTCAYLFVDADQALWDPWWASLFEYLQKLEPPQSQWQYEPDQNVALARAELTDLQRTALFSFLLTAPPGEVATHQTLRRALGLSEDQVRRLEVMFFADPDLGRPPSA